MSASNLKPPAAQLTLAQASAWSGISRTTLYRMNTAGEIVFRKFGRRVLIDSASLVAAIERAPQVKSGIASRPRAQFNDASIAA